MNIEIIDVSMTKTTLGEHVTHHIFKNYLHQKDLNSEQKDIWNKVTNSKHVMRKIIIIKNNIAVIKMAV